MYQPKVVQGECPLRFVNLYGVIRSNALFSNPSILTSSHLLKVLEHLIWSNTSAFRFWVPLARTSADCKRGRRTRQKASKIKCQKFFNTFRLSGVIHL